MLHYQVSPPKKETKKPVEESAAPAFLTLGAFSAVPKLHFETVILGQTKKRTLIVRNPNETACFLKFLKKPSAAFKLHTGADGQDILVPPADQVEITIEWTPKEEGQCFETFQVQGSTAGTSRLSVHLLGKCLPPPKKQGARRRPVTVSTANAGPPKANDPTLKIASKTSLPAKAPAKVTIPHSPNFSTRFTNRTSTANGGAPASVSSTPAFKNPVDKTFVSPNPLEKLSSIVFPFTPEPSQSVAHRGQGDSVVTKEEEALHSPAGPMDPQKTFLLEQEASSLASPSRRETYLVSPAPTKMGHAVSNLACHATVPIIESGITTTKTEDDSGVPPLEEVNGRGTSNQDNSTSGIELDQHVLDSITKALDDELDLKLVHRSVDRILDQVNDISSEEQRKEIEAKFSRLTELSDENAFMNQFDLEEEDLQLGTKAGSGEFLCMDQMDLVPNFPSDETKVDTELMASIKQMLKDGKTDEEILAQHAESENMTKEIRALYDELSNKYKSCRECYEIAKAAHLSESFTFHRIVIQKAIKNNEIQIKPDVDICSFKSKTSIISSLLSSYNRPWLWSALCLVFHNDKLAADDIDIMNFIDDNLFWNNELMDGFEFGESGANTPTEFLDMLVPKFLQNYLEIVYLLDATGIPSVFVPNNSTKKLLDTFQSEYLHNTDLNQVLDRIPVKLVEPLDPIHYLIQDNLRGPNVAAWTNIVKLVQELTENDPDKPRLSCNSSTSESMKESLTVALTEVQKLGIPCELPGEEDFDWLLYGCASAVDEKLVWQLVLRIRIAQCKKQQSSEE